MTNPVSAFSALSAAPPREAGWPASAPTGAGAVARQSAVADPAQRKPDATPPQLSSALADINQSLKLASIGVQFEFDKEAHTMIAKVVDVETGEVIRQMPSAEMLKVSKVLGHLQGLLLSQKV